jgi:hypothetical protein
MACRSSQLNYIAAALMSVSLALLGVAAASPVTAASVSGSPVVDARTAFGTDYLNPDGSHSLDLADQPVNYQGSNGTWAPIDNTLVADGAGGFTNAANSWRVHFGPAGQGLTVATSAGVLRMAGQGAGRTSPIVSGSTITYPNAWPNADLVYSVTGGQVTEAIVLHTAAAQTSYPFSIRTGASSAASSPVGLVTNRPTRSNRPVRSAA